MVSFAKPEKDQRQPRLTGIRQISESGAPVLFATTHWSVVLSACQELTTQNAAALEQLCGTYWYPLFAFLRRSGYDVADAQDLTQSFFAHLLEKDRLQTVNRAKGKFRSFLIASLKNFLANEYDKRRALKRGAQYAFVPLDTQSNEARYCGDPFHELTPDRVFDRSWALALVEKTMHRLREEYAAENKASLLDALQIYLSGDKGGMSYSEMAVRLQLSEGAVKMAVLRLRRRFGELLREEVACTVSTPSEVDEEIRYLFASVSS
jgi:RNA polymerase sigma factor (sigma-70 family)